MKQRAVKEKKPLWTGQVEHDCYAPRPLKYPDNPAYFPANRRTPLLRTPAKPPLIGAHNNSDWTAALSLKWTSNEMSLPKRTGTLQFTDLIKPHGGHHHGM